MHDLKFEDREKEQLEGFLNRICESYELESEWLDLLAQLEYVGCRKIMKSVGFGQVDSLLLQHLQEEATHALLLKRNSERRGLKRSWMESKLGEWGWDYFQTVDHAVSKLVEEKETLANSDYPPCYQLVSFAIEERVLWLYPHYIEKTGDGAVKRALKQILAQEKHHGERFQRFEVADVRAVALGTERVAWSQFMERLTEWAAQSD